MTSTLVHAQSRQQIAPSSSPVARRRRILIALAVVAAVVAIVIAVAASSLRGGGDVPSGAAEHGGFTLSTGQRASSDAHLSDGAAHAVHLDLFSDYADPETARFASTNALAIQSYAERGLVEVSVHPIVGGATEAERRESLRAGNAVACVGEYAPASLWSFHSGLLALRTGITPHAMTTDDLVALAGDAGVARLDPVAECIRGDRFAGWLTSVSDRAHALGVGPNAVPIDRLPTVLADGARYDGGIDNGDEFRGFLAEHAGSGARE